MNMQNMRVHDIASALLTSRPNINERALGMEMMKRLPLYGYQTALIMPVNKSETGNGLSLHYIRNYKELMHSFTGNSEDALRLACKKVSYAPIANHPYVVNHHNVVMITIDNTDQDVYSILKNLADTTIIYIAPETDPYTKLNEGFLKANNRRRLRARILPFSGTKLMRSNHVAMDGVNDALYAIMDWTSNPAHQLFTCLGYNDDRLVDDGTKQTIPRLEFY